MADETLPTYAKAGGPPDDWTEMQVFNAETGEMVGRVTEVNTAEGWAEVIALDENGRAFMQGAGGEVVTVRITGDFRLQRRPVG